MVSSSIWFRCIALAENDDTLLTSLQTMIGYYIMHESRSLDVQICNRTSRLLAPALLANQFINGDETMIIETIFTNMLILAAFLCTLATGFILLFAIVVMPGIGTLSDRDFLRAFQVIDRVIQNSQPLFILVWAGSVAALFIAALLGFRQLEGISRILMIVAAVLYIVGVQLPTGTVNIPLDN